MRDRGYDFWSYDAYSISIYTPAHALSEPPMTGMDVLTSFEVLEHFANPATECFQIFGTKADVLILSTELFRGQDASWDYLAQETGQHVFFFSAKALAGLARRFGYTAMGWNNLLIFMRNKDPASLEFFRTEPSQLYLRGLRLFAEHQRDPYKWIQLELAEAR